MRYKDGCKERFVIPSSERRSPIFLHDNNSIMDTTEITKNVLFAPLFLVILLVKLSFWVGFSYHQSRPLSTFLDQDRPNGQGTG
jgi:hypothetical protein